MAKDDVDLDALGLSDEELGLGSSGSSGSGRGAGRRSGRATGGGGGKGRGFLLFLLGLALGVAGALVAPRFLAPYLPVSLRGESEVVEGEVLGKRLEGERLLLTVETPRGAVLATFRERVAEIDLLVEEGDSVSLGLGRYRPFVDDPAVEGVRKSVSGERRAERPGEPSGAAPGVGPDTTAAGGPDTTAGGEADSAAGPVPPPGEGGR